MAGLREAREMALIAYDQNMINDLDFALLYDMNRSKNPDFPYWNYRNFELDSISEADCWANFRFYRDDLYRLADVLQLPDDLICYNGTKVNKIEGLCIFLKRFAYPCRLGDIVPKFGRPVPEISLISNKIMDFVYDNFNHKLRDMNQQWLAPQKLREYADAVHAKGAPLDFC